MTTKKKVYTMSWEQYNNLSEILVHKLTHTSIKFNSILAISRGGLPIGVFLSHQLDIPLFVISTKFYDIKKDFALHIDKNISGIGSMKSPILIVDEINDTGVTILGVQEYLHTHWEITRIQKEEDGSIETHTAVLVEKTHTKIKADYRAFYTEKKDWIRFPYEKIPVGKYIVDFDLKMS
jgi:hypoxanthine phosphoribosyltransferase